MANIDLETILVIIAVCAASVLAYDYWAKKSSLGYTNNPQNSYQNLHHSTVNPNYPLYVNDSSKRLGLVNRCIHDKKCTCLGGRCRCTGGRMCPHGF